MSLNDVMVEEKDESKVTYPFGVFRDLPKPENKISAIDDIIKDIWTSLDEKGLS